MSPASAVHGLTLEQIENDVWPDPGPSTHLVSTCHELRKVPIAKLSVENLRMLIAQNIGLAHLLPVALDHLERDPWAAGDFHEGDLLESVLRTDPAFWAAHAELRMRLDEVVVNLKKKRDLFDERILPAWQKIYG